MNENNNGGALTDGTGVSPMNATKIIKDLVADGLLSATAALVAINVVSIEGAIAQPQVVAFAVAGALIRVLYRFALRWTAS